MRLATRLSLAQQKAEALLREDGITGLEVDPFAIAASRDIEVRPKPSSVEGVSGMLLRHGDAFGIYYATHIPNEGFQRFSVAHELGHYFLDGHLDHILPTNGIHHSRAGFISADRYEMEADHFASGLLMPSKPFKRECNRESPGLAAVESLAACCKTSLTATASRFAELTDDAVAVVISTGRVVDYCILSDRMKSLRDITWLRKGTPVPHRTQTSSFNADTQRVSRAERVQAEVDVMDWLGGRHSATLTEEVIGLGRYGKTLTILASEHIGREEEEDEEVEEEILERWTPQFKR